MASFLLRFQQTKQLIEKENTIEGKTKVLDTIAEQV